MSSISSGSSHDDNCMWCSALAKCISPDTSSPAGCGPSQCIRAPDGGDSANCSSTAGWPGVACPGFVPPPPPPPVSPKIWNSSACSCADYCDYKVRYAPHACAPCHGAS